MLTAMTIIASVVWVLGYYPIQNEAIDKGSEPFEYVLLFFLWPLVVLCVMKDDLKN